MSLVAFGTAGPAFAAPDHVVHPRPGRLDRPSRLLLAAVQAAAPSLPTPDIGVFVATAHGAFSANAEHWNAVLASGPTGASPLVFPATVPSAAAGELAVALGAMGPNVTLCGARDAAHTIMHMAQTSLAARECRLAIVAAVSGWHSALTRLGGTPERDDGAICACLATGGERRPAVQTRTHENPLFHGFLEIILQLTNSR